MDEFAVFLLKFSALVNKIRKRNSKTSKIGVPGDRHTPINLENNTTTPDKMSTNNASPSITNNRQDTEFFKNFKQFVNTHFQSTDKNPSIFEIANMPMFISAEP